jgi:hypothetical protein
MIKDSLQEDLEKPLYDFFNSLSRKNHTVSEVYNVLDKYHSSKWKKYDGIISPILILVFKYDKENKDYTLDFSTRYSDFTKIRVNYKIRYCQYLFSIYDQILTYMKEKKYTKYLPKKDFEIFLCITDDPFWAGEDLPIFSQAKPENFNSPLYFDWTFFMMKFDFDNETPRYNWDLTVETFRKLRIARDAREVSIRKKIFFRGMNTTHSSGGNMSLIREHFDTFAKESSKADIKVINISAKKDEQKKNFVSLFDEINYNMYLDLPGNYPWSYRKKFLYLTGGDVVVVSQKWQAADGSWKDESDWITAFDLWLPISKWETRVVESSYIVKQNPEVYYKNNKETFNKVIKLKPLSKDYIDKRLEYIEKLTNERIYQYMAYSIILAANWYVKNI